MNNFEYQMQAMRNAQNLHILQYMGLGQNQLPFQNQLQAAVQNHLKPLHSRKLNAIESMEEDLKNYLPKI